MTLTGDILIKDGTVIQPEVDFCGKADVLISDGCIKAVLKHGEPAKASKTFHADNCIVTPGLIDFLLMAAVKSASIRTHSCSRRGSRLLLIREHRALRMSTAFIKMSLRRAK